jgi:hypothetical protein
MRRIFYSVLASTVALFILYQSAGLAYGDIIYCTVQAGLHDTTSPITTVTTSPLSPDGTGSWFVTEPVVTLAPDELAMTYYAWNSAGGPFVTYSVPFSAPAGENTLYYYSVDGSSNMEGVKSALFKVDTSAPSSFTTAPSEGQRISGTSYTVSGTASDSSFSGVAQVEISVNGGSWQLVNGSASWSYTWALPEDGTYNIKSRATDNAGNIETPGAGINVTLDNTAPRIVSTNPANSAEGVPISTNVTAIFSEDMDPATIDTSTFTLKDGANAPVLGTVLYDSIAETATFTPDNNLSYSTTYTATVTTGVKDLVGNGLAADYVFSFTAEAAPDSTPPTTSLTTNPASPNGSNGWFKTKPLITLTANEPAIIYYKWEFESTYTTFASAFEAPEDSHTLSCYSVDTTGNTGATGSTLFNVDTVSPSSFVGDPSEGQRIRGTSYTIKGTSSDSSSLVASLEVSADGGETWSLATNTEVNFSTWAYVWTLPSDGNYNVISRATDNAGNAESAGVNVIVDNTAPTVSSTSPINGATGAAVTSNVTATFSEDIDPNTMNTANFTLYKGRARISGSVSYDAAPRTATFDPDSNLSYNATYTATATTGVKDLAGNALASNYVFRFTTAKKRP